MNLPISVYANLTEVETSYQGYLLDAWGVFWGGNGVGLLQGAKAAMAGLVADGKIVGILSNSTQLTAKEIEKYQAAGLIQGEHFHFLITSGELARTYFINRKPTFPIIHKQFYVFGGKHPHLFPHKAIFESTSFEETDDINAADFIYVGIPHIEGEDQTDPELFSEAVQALKNHLPMVCANPDRFAHEGNPPKMVVRQGFIADTYKQMGGTVLYIGKPYEDAFSTAMQQFHRYAIDNPKQILMIGDTPETDIRGGRNFGMATALTTQTGMMSERILSLGLKGAVNALSAADRPDYYIGKFAREI